MADRAVEGGFVPGGADVALTQQEFNARWTFDQIPACPVGMELLYAFFQASPIIFYAALDKDFYSTDKGKDLVHPAFRVNKRWIAFRDHRNTCENCNEF